MTPEEERHAISAAAKAFRDANPEFRRSNKIAQEMIEFMQESDLSKTDAQSWQAAYDHVCRESVGYSTGKFLEDGRAELYVDIEAVDRMPASVLREQLKDPIFARGVNLVLGDEK